MMERKPCRSFSHLLFICFLIELYSIYTNTTVWSAAPESLDCVTPSWSSVFCYTVNWWGFLPFVSHIIQVTTRNCFCSCCTTLMWSDLTVIFLSVSLSAAPSLRLPSETWHINKPDGTWRVAEATWRVFVGLCLITEYCWRHHVVSRNICHAHYTQSNSPIIEVMRKRCKFLLEMCIFFTIFLNQNLSLLNKISSNILRNPWQWVNCTFWGVLSL